MKMYTTKWDHVTLHTIYKKKNVKSVASLELEC